MEYHSNRRTRQRHSSWQSSRAAGGSAGLVADVAVSKENTMTQLIALYFALPAIFMTAVTVRDVIFGDFV